MSRVEWLALDSFGDEHRYISHDMPAADADAMAATLRQNGVVDVAVIHSTAG